LEATREDHTTLRAFLRRMPKGGDLHTHLSGSVYAEHPISLAHRFGAGGYGTACGRSLSSG
jgi:hypothetical protein